MRTLSLYVSIDAMNWIMDSRPRTQVLSKTSRKQCPLVYNLKEFRSNHAMRSSATSQVSTPHVVVNHVLVSFLSKGFLTTACVALLSPAASSPCKPGPAFDFDHSVVRSSALFLSICGNSLCSTPSLTFA
jgi:hypothetical protein